MAPRTASAWSTPSSSGGSSAWGMPDATGGYSWGTRDIPTNTFNDVFTGAVNTQDFAPSWATQLNAPSTSIPTYGRSDAPSWMDFGKAALDIASKWRGTSATSPSSSSRRGQTVSSPGSEVTNLGSGYTLINRAPTTKQKTTGGSSGGIGGAIGTIAGIGASFIPGLGPGIAAAMPAIGGTAGSLFG